MITNLWFDLGQVGLSPVFSAAGIQSGSPDDWQMSCWSVRLMDVELCSPWLKAILIFWRSSVSLCGGCILCALALL
jgi:hypothetical protein